MARGRSIEGTKGRIRGRDRMKAGEGILLGVGSGEVRVRDMIRSWGRGEADRVVSKGAKINFIWLWGRNPVKFIKEKK